jgi:hypothetical protein
MQNTQHRTIVLSRNEVRTETPMQERVEGQGRLETIAPPEKVSQVSYRFDIVANIVRKPNSSVVAVRSDNTGAVLSLNRKPIPEGGYALHTDDGEIIRVRNLGLGEWAILAS